MGIPLPKVAGTLSDATKLGWEDIDQTVSKLIYLPVIVDNFENLNAWTETDADGKVNLSGGVVSMDGGDTLGTHGITKSFTRAEGYFEIKVSVPTTALSSMGLNLHNNSALPGFGVAGDTLFYFAGGPLIGSYDIGNLIFFTGTYAINTYYTIRIYVNKDLFGNYSLIKFTIQGGIYTVETMLFQTVRQPITANPMYFSAQRYASSPSNKASFKEFRWYSGYATDGPTTEFVHDAGSGMVFNNFDCTALAMPAGMSSTNLKFAYSFDTGSASYSAYLTLAQLNAIGKITANRRYIRIKVQNNSDGATLVYGAKPSSATATDGVFNESRTTVAGGGNVILPAASVVLAPTAYGPLGELVGELSVTGITLNAPTFNGTIGTSTSGPFGATQGTGFVRINGYDAPVISWADGVISFTTPITLVEGQTYTLYVRKDSGVAAATTFSSSSEIKVVTTPNLPVKQRIMNAIIDGLLTINTDTAYNYSVRRVYNPAVPIENMKEFPAINVWEGDEQCANSNTGSHLQTGGNQALLNNSFDLELDCFIQDQNNLAEARNKMLADIQRYFGNHWWIPDTTGAAQALQSFYIGSSPMGEEVNRPLTGISARFRIWYTQQLTDPTQS